LLEAGTKEDILEFLSSKDLVNEAGFSFNKIYFLMKDKDFWLKTIDILRTKRIFEATIWQYAIFHAKDIDLSLVREAIYLTQFTSKSQIFGDLGFYCDSKLVTVDRETSDKQDIHLEYSPMVNARVHQLKSGQGNQILNRNFKNSYSDFLVAAAQRKGLASPDDRLRFVYYLQL